MRAAWLLLAALAGCTEHPAAATPPPAGRYQIVSAPVSAPENDPEAHALAVWRLDTATGALQFCQADSKVPFMNKPVCSFEAMPFGP